jgi:hypothetical protein
MATSTHKITATRSGSTEREDWDIEYQITFTFWPSERATLVCPGAEPGIEFAKVEPMPRDQGAFQDLADARVRDWAEQWLEDHYDEAVQVATDDRLADEDDHADFLRRQRRDDRLTGDL